MKRTGILTGVAVVAVCCALTLQSPRAQAGEQVSLDQQMDSGTAKLVSPCVAGYRDFRHSL